LNITPTGENTLRIAPWQTPHSVSGASWNDWTTSIETPHSVQRYW
jgi:hypothetical protein